MITDVDDWKVELLFSGRIVQDGDETVSPNEAERRFNRYIELVELVEGNEGQDVFQALIDSIQAGEDYGAYQATMEAAEKFPEPKYARYLTEALPALIKRQPDWAGDFLVSIANHVEFGDEARIHSFNQQLRECAGETRQAIVAFIRKQEHGGWLEHRVGVLAPE